MYIYIYIYVHIYIYIYMYVCIFRRPTTLSRPPPNQPHPSPHTRKNKVFPSIQTKPRTLQGWCCRGWTGSTSRGRMMCSRLSTTKSLLRSFLPLTVRSLSPIFFRKSGPEVLRGSVGVALACGTTGGGGITSPQIGIKSPLICTGARDLSYTSGHYKRRFGGTMER